MFHIYTSTYSMMLVGGKGETRMGNPTHTEYIGQQSGG
jgi:hypothetical protein